MTDKLKPQLTPIFSNLEAALKVWWQNLKKFILVYCWGMLCALLSLAVAFIFFGLDHQFSSGGNLPFHILAILLAVAGVLGTLYFYIRAYLGMFLLVKKNYQGTELEIFKETGRYFWPYLGLALLNLVLVLLWCCLLIIPGIIYAILYSLACYVFFFEERRGWDAIRRSVSLVETYWWPVFWRYVAIGLLTWLTIMVISIPLYLTSDTSIFFQIWNIVVQMASFLVGPIVLLYTYNIYQDLARIKK